MNRLHVCIVFFIFAVIAARAEQTNTLTTDGATSNAAPGGITTNATPGAITIDGTTYEEVRWGRVTPATVTIFHKTGVATIPLEKLPTELQQRFGYDPRKAAQWRDAQTKAESERRAAKEKADREASERRAKIAASEAWHVTIEAISAEGIIANGWKGRIQMVPRTSGGQIVGFSPEQPDSVDIVLVGHPQQNQLAEGNFIQIYAYRDGVANVDGRTLEKWVYCGFCTLENMQDKYK